MVREQKKRMTKEESEDWDKLYEFVHTKLFNYDSNQALSRTSVLKLKGLSTGKYIESKKIEDRASYSFKVILNTFKYCYPEITRCLNTINFKDDNHKMNYILKIVESKLNTVYQKMKDNSKTQERIKEADTSISTYIGAEFKPKNNTKKDKFSDLW